MNGTRIVEAIAAWWRGGAEMMPAILVVGLLLYGRLGAMAWSFATAPPACGGSAGCAGAGCAGAGTCGAGGRLSPGGCPPPDRASGAPPRSLRLLTTDAAAVERDLRLVGVLAAALPLLGLLGTVTGMVRTFADLAVSGGGGIAAAAGIGIALTTTQYGIALALPALVAAALLHRRAARQRSRPC